MVRIGKRIFNWHHWCGLIVGVFLLVMSLSGASLVFIDEIEGAYQSPWIKVDNPRGMYSYDVSCNQVRKKYPDWEMRLYDQPGINEAIVYDLRKGAEMKKVFVHPVDGHVLHVSENAQNQWHRQLLTLHYTLFAGTTGKVTVFFIGLLFLSTLITGLYIYRKALVKVLLFRVRINRKTGKGLSSSLHRVVGVWSLLFNLLIVITGLFISGDIALTAVKKAASKKASATIAPLYSTDQMKSEVNRQYPDFTIHMIKITGNSNLVQFYGNFESDPFYYGKYYSRFYYDGATGKLQRKEWLKDQQPFKKWQSIKGPLHFGNYGGLPLKIFYCILGLTPGLLSVSGFLLWIRRRRRSVAPLSFTYKPVN